MLAYELTIKVVFCFIQRNTKKKKKMGGGGGHAILL